MVLVFDRSLVRRGHGRMFDIATELFSVCDEFGDLLIRFVGPSVDRRGLAVDRITVAGIAGLIGSAHPRDLPWSAVIETGRPVTAARSTEWRIAVGEILRGSWCWLSRR